jgi:O-antigen/teichoic acid export membrane protein
MSTLRLSIVSFGLRVALLLVVVANALVLARKLGPPEFGKYFLLVRLVSVLAALADFGLSQSANAFFGRYREWGRHLHRTVLRLIPRFWLGVTAAGGLIVWLAGDWLLPEFPRALVLIAFAILPLSLYANLWNSMMIGMGRVLRVNVVQLVLCTLSLGLTLVFVVALHGRLLAAALIYLALMVIQFAAMLLMASRLHPDETTEGPPADLPRQMLHFGLRGYVGSLSTLLWTRFPVFLLNATHGAVAVGIFSVAQHLVEKMLLPVQAMQDVIYQKMSVLASRTATLAMNRYLRITWWGMLVVALAGLLVVPWVITLPLGAAYSGAVPVARILLLGTAFASLSLLLDAYFINQLHRPGLVSILAWGNVLAGLALALLMIPALGERGAAWALSLTQILGAGVYLVIYLRVTRTPLAQLARLHDKDVSLLREQVGAMLRWRESRG